MNPLSSQAIEPQTPNDPWKLFRKVPDRVVFGIGISDFPGVGTMVKGSVRELTNNGAILEVGYGILGYLHRRETVEMPRLGETTDVCISKIKFRGTDHVMFLLDKRGLPDDPWKTIEERYAVGSRAIRRVTETAQYCLYVEFSDGQVARVNNSNLSWNKGVRPTDFPVGKEIEVVISGIDKTARKMSASIKAAIDDPWQKIDQIYSVGAIAAARVVAVARYGALAELGIGCVGLLHRSGIPDSAPRLNAGEVIRVKLESIDKSRRKVQLSLAAASVIPVISDDIGTV